MPLTASFSKELLQCHGPGVRLAGPGSWALELAGSRATFVVPSAAHLCGAALCARELFQRLSPQKDNSARRPYACSPLDFGFN